jgi:hypothetical protein
VVKKRLVINVQNCRYPVIKKVAKYEFGFFLSGRDMFGPVNGQIILDANGNGSTVVTKGLSKDPDEDYFDIFWMDCAG